VGFGTNSTAVSIYYNIIYNTMNRGIHIGDYGSGTSIYNNVIYGVNPLSAFNSNCIEVISGSTGIIIKNNIAMNKDVCLKVELLSSITSCDYNCWYQSAGGTAKYVRTGTDPYLTYHYDDFAAYKAATGWDTNGKWEDPKFVNAGGSTAADYILASNSPCISTGCDVGLTQDYGGTAVWGPVTMGAYQYTGQKIRMILAR
jgi:hypothetical protein